MTPRELLTCLGERRIVLRTDGNVLHYDAPARTMNPLLRSALLKHKQWLIRLLNTWTTLQQAKVRVVCPACWPDLDPSIERALLVLAGNDSHALRQSLCGLGMGHLRVIKHDGPLDGFRPENFHTHDRRAALSPVL